MRLVLGFRGFCAVLAMAVAGCDAPAIQRIDLVQQPITQNMSPDQKESVRDANRVVLARDGAKFRVSGRGTCGRIRVWFGDGTQQDVFDADLGAGVIVPHTYRGWGGPKTVRAETVEDCIGTAQTTGVVEPPSKSVFVGGQVASACNPITGFPPVRAGTVITARALNTPEAQMSFGGFLRRGIDGSPEAALGPPFTFPFPGLRAHSLVWRVGTQVEQGGVNRSFTVRTTGPLELCINDDTLGDNGGAWGIDLIVDESGAP